MTLQSKLSDRPTSPGGRRSEGRFTQKLTSTLHGKVSERALYETAHSIIAQWQKALRDNDWFQSEGGIYLEAQIRPIDNVFRKRLQTKMNLLCKQVGIPAKVDISVCASEGDNCRHVYLTASRKENSASEIREKLLDKRVVNFHLRSVIPAHAEAEQQRLC